MEQFNLDPKMIYDHEFSIEFKGYSTIEVDSMLDKVIEDYQNFDKISNQLIDKIQFLEKQNATLKAKILELEGKLSVEAKVDNTDLLKRISRLEQEVFNR